MEYKEIKQLMEDMENSNLSSLDISLPDGTKINIKKDIEKNVKEYNESNKKINIKNEKDFWKESLVWRGIIITD